MTLMMPPCSRTGAFAGSAWVMDTMLCRMPLHAEKCGLAGQRPATGRAQRSCYWRCDRIYLSGLLVCYSFIIPPHVAHCFTPCIVSSSGLRGRTWCFSGCSQVGPAELWDQGCVAVRFSFTHNLSYLNLQPICTTTDLDLHTYSKEIYALHTFIC